MKYVTVSADALREVLQALNSSTSHVQSLQKSRGPSANNPIDTLCNEYNAAVMASNVMVEISAGERR